MFGTLVRGLYYKVFKQCLPWNCVTTWCRIDPLHVQDTWALFKNRPYDGPFGLGEVFTCVVMHGDDLTTTMWLIGFYNSMWFMLATEAPSSSAPVAELVID